MVEVEDEVVIVEEEEVVVDVKRQVLMVEVVVNVEDEVEAFVESVVGKDVVVMVEKQLVKVK